MLETMSLSGVRKSGATLSPPSLQCAGGNWLPAPPVRATTELEQSVGIFGLYLVVRKQSKLLKV